MMWSREDTGIQIFVYEHTMPRLLKSRITLIHQGQVVRKVDNTIHCINPFPVDSIIGLPNTYPLDSDLSSIWHYSTINNRNVVT